MGSNYYTKIIVLGSGKLAYQCAIESRKYLQDIEVLEYKVTNSTVLQKLCQKDNIPYQCLDKAQLFDYLWKQSVQVLVVSAGNTYIIGRSIIEKLNLTIINWHNALLPRHKGRNAEAWSIFEGDSVTGITWHMITENVDTGDIIAQRNIPIDDTTTALKLFQQQCDLGIQVFAEILESILDNTFVLKKQEKQENEQLHFSYQIPNNGFLDIDWSYHKISCFLRAMDYGALQLLGAMHVKWEGQVYEFRKYRLSEAHVEDAVVWQEGNLVIYKENHEIVLKSLQKCLIYA